MSQVIITESYLEDIADAIREKNGSSNTYTPSQMAGAIGSIMSPSASDEGKVVYSGAFSQQGSMSIASNGSYDTTFFSNVNVSIPEAVLISKTITSNGVYNPEDDNADAYSQVSVSIPEAVFVSKTITSNGTYNPSDDNADAFSQVVVNVSGGGGGTGSDEILIGNVSGSYVNNTISSVRASAFLSNKNVTYIGMESVTVIPGGFANYASNLQKISFPNCTTISNYDAFANCKNLSEAYLPKVVTLGARTFQQCEKLTEINMPECVSIQSSTFSSCYSLGIASFAKCSKISAAAFAICRMLSKLILLSTSVCSLQNGNVFNNCGLTMSTYLGYFGSVYVPASLVDAYKSAPNWSAISDRITSYVEG